MPPALRRAAAVIAMVVLGCSGRDGCDPCASSAPTVASTAPGSEAPASDRPTPVPGSSNPRTAPTSAAPPLAGAWAKLEVQGSSPARREDHTWTVDADAAVAYLFGGRDGGTSFGDLWAFDLAAGTWTELRRAGATPPARFGHEAAWVPGRGLVVTLGQAGSGFFDDVWLFDPAAGSWRELRGDGDRPIARYGSCSGIGPDGRLWISHGFTEEGSRFFDTRAYDVDEQDWTDETPPDRQPVERCLHSCWWTDSGDFVLYGGQTTGVAALGDLWHLEDAQPGHPGAWRKLDDPVLAARQLPAVARYRGGTLVIGGRDVGRKPLGDAWRLADDGSAALPLEARATEPPARSGASLIADAARDRVLLFGGIGDAALGDLWQLTFD
jgi:galactose oxidase-like protein